MLTSAVRPGLCMCCRARARECVQALLIGRGMATWGAKHLVCGSVRDSSGDSMIMMVRVRGMLVFYESIVMMIDVHINL